jgi:tetratricopeptide (TPR) repeat protein
MRRLVRPHRASAKAKTTKTIRKKKVEPRKRVRPVVIKPSPAVELFQRAIKSLNKKDFSRALGLFDELIEAYPEERDVIERARAYRAMCARYSERRAPRPKTFEDLLHYGIYHHNRGEYQEALKYLNQAAEIHPRNEHVLYCVAAAAARVGDATVAFKALRGAIATNPASRAQARTDPDFDGLRQDAQFASLLS